MPEAMLAGFEARSVGRGPTRGLRSFVAGSGAPVVLVHGLEPPAECAGLIEGFLARAA